MSKTTDPLSLLASVEKKQKDVERYLLRLNRQAHMGLSAYAEVRVIKGGGKRVNKDN